MSSVVLRRIILSRPPKIWPRDKANSSEAFDIRLCRGIIAKKFRVNLAIGCQLRDPERSPNGTTTRRTLMWLELSSCHTCCKPLAGALLGTWRMIDNKGVDSQSAFEWLSCPLTCPVPCPVLRARLIFFVKLVDAWDAGQQLSWTSIAAKGTMTTFQTQKLFQYVHIFQHCQTGEKGRWRVLLWNEV